MPLSFLFRCSALAIPLVLIACSTDGNVDGRDERPSIEASAPPADAVEEGAVYDYRLANDMKVLVKVDRRSPVAVNQVWYQVGSSYEHNGITGVSHVLEHMMFKGTKNLAPGEFSEIVARYGGEQNAFTGRDYTAYFQTIASEHLDRMMELEAERMRRLNMDPEAFEKEVKVVVEERLWRTEDKPKNLTHEQFMATLFMNSPYHHPVIGWRQDLESLTLEDAADWYRRWYAPNRATLVVVGDVDPRSVFEGAEAHFGGFEAEDLAPPKPQSEVPQSGQRRIRVHDRTEQPHLYLGWKVPSLATVEEGEEWQVFALDVLSSILDGGASSRLQRELVRDRAIAQSAGASYNLASRLTTAFTLSGTPADSSDLDELEGALLEQIDRLKSEPVSEDELKRVKSQVVASDIYQKDSMFYQGMVLGMLETVGIGWQRADDYVAGIEAVTAEQVKAVARRYFNERSLTAAELLPEAEQAGESKHE
ncbi:MAG: M16 family metallopeptidase [Pseudomonadota bacterium]